jgi:hypothetical protein
MANKKKLTEEQESQIKILLANNEMLEKTKQEVKEKGKKVDQIVRAQQEVIDHINSIDPTVLKNPQQYAPKKETKTNELFGDTDMSIFDMLKAIEDEKQDLSPYETKTQQVSAVKEEEEYDLTPS